MADNNINTTENVQQNTAPASGTNQADKIEEVKKELKMIKAQLKGAAEYCLPLKIVVNIEAENRSKKAYYDTCGKNGVLCLLQSADFGGNKKDEAVLTKFFKETLGFEYKKYDDYGSLCALKKDFDLKTNYCLIICISGHGGENGVKIGEDQFATVADIGETFGNAQIKELSGVPKIIMLDVCRGSGVNKTVLPESKDTGPEPTKSSDVLFIHATTLNHQAFVPVMTGSVGIQNVTKVLKKNWENDHLEEMLIDARMKVAESGNPKVRQTLEIQTTLTKRLMLRKSD